MRTTFDAATIDAFLHHLHFIPASRGETRVWMEANAPGWTPETLAEALVEAGAIESTAQHFSGWRRVDSVTSVDLA